MTTMTSTSKAGLKVTTHVTVIDRTGVDNAVAICNPEPLRMLDDEPCVWLEALIFAAVILVVCGGFLIRRML